MSTAARKERKRSGVAFVHTPKEGTPVEDRVENRRREITPAGSLVPRRFGRTSKVIARLKAFGISDQPAAKK